MTPPRRRNAKPLAPRAARVARPAPAPATAPLQSSWVQPGFLAMAVVLAWVGQDLWLNRELAAGAWFWLAAALAAAAAGWRQPARIEEPGIPLRGEAWILAGIVLLGLVVRSWRLAEIPNGYFFDEATNSLLGQQILQNPTYLPIFGPAEVPAPTLYHYLIAVAMKIGGISRLASRWVPAVAGTLTVIPVYFLARRIVSRPVALATALVLVLMRWHINFSRINFIGIMTPLLGALAVYFLVRGIETRNRWHMALSGIAVSLGLYTYFASNLIPLVIGPYLVLQLLWERDFLRRQWLGVLIFLGTAVLVFAPLGIFALREPQNFFSRNGQVLIFNHVPPDQAWAAVWQNVKTTLLMFQYYGDTNGRHNLPEAPMLDPITGVLAGLGLVWAMTHLRHRHAALIVLWFLVAVVPGFITIEAPQGYRCIGAIVPVALLTAFGLERIWQGMRSLNLGDRFWLYAAAVLAAIVLWSGALNLRTYFGAQAKHVACWSEFSAREAAIGNWLQEQGPQVHAYISAGSFDYPTIRFLAYPYLESEPFQLTTTIPTTDTGSKDVAYVLLPIHDGALELLRYYYPRGQEQLHESPYDFTLFTSYRVSRQEINASRGLQTTCRDASGRVAQGLAQGDGSPIELAQGPGQFPVKVAWQGSLRTPRWSRYAFQVRNGSGAEVRVDGERVPSSGVRLSQGLHTLQVRAQASGPGRVSLLWQDTAAGSFAPIPGQALFPQDRVHGLSGTYWHSADWTGEPAVQRVDPLISLLGADFPLVAPFSARWEGRIQIPATGNYVFGTLSNEFSSVWLDDQVVVQNTVADAYAEGAIQLTAGPHRIRIDYQKTAGAYPRIVLYWIPAGGAKHKVPFTALETR